MVKTHKILNLSKRRSITFVSGGGVTGESRVLTIQQAAPSPSPALSSYAGNS
jgi:hypothetical protein